MLSFYVARKWENCLSNSVDPGWVPTKMGGSNAPDDLHEGYKTQVWLAISNEKEALVSGNYFRHQRQRAHHHEAKNSNLQDQLISVCETISGIKLNDK